MTCLNALFVVIVIVLPQLRSAWAQSQAHRIQAVVSRARASLDAGRGAVSERAERHAAVADGAHLARPLRAPRIREERLRRGDRQRQGPAAHRDAARSASVGRRRPRRHGRRHLQDLRRSHRRHVSRHRRHARAHQHSGGADVRARLVRAAGARHVRAAARQDSGASRRSCSRPPIRWSSPRRTSTT